MKTNFILIGVIVVLITALYFVFDLWRKESDNSDRLYTNFEVLVKKEKFNRDSTIATIKAITLEKNEVKNLVPDLIDKLDKIDVKLRNLESFQEIGLSINAKFLANIKDSLIKGDSVKLAYYSDKYISYISEITKSGNTAPTEFKIDVNLDNALHRERQKGFLWGIFKPRIYEITTSTDNPYVKLKYNKLIKLK